MEQNSQMPLTKHLEELRRRLIISLIGVLIGFLLSYGFAEKIFKFLASPLIAALPEDGHMALLRVTEGFFTYLKVSFFSGVILASPVIIYQIWAFIAPGLYKKEKRVILPFVFFSVLLFIIGIVFGYLVVFPFGFKFLLRYATGNIQASLSIHWYVSFAMRLLLAFGFIFQLPLAMFFLAQMGLINDRMLRKNRKYAVLAAFLVGAILTPPDVFTQALMAGPLIILYEISIWLAKLAYRKRQAVMDEEPGEEAGSEEEESSQAGPSETPPAG